MDRRDERIPVPVPPACAVALHHMATAGNCSMGDVLETAIGSLWETFCAEEQARRDAARSTARSPQPDLYVIR